MKMTEKEINEILSTYSEADAEIITGSILVNAMIGTTKSPDTPEEFREFCEETIRKHKEFQKKEAERKAKREAAKQRKIERDLAQGITPEMRKGMTFACCYQRKINDLEVELAELKAKRDYWAEKAKG